MTQPLPIVALEVTGPAGEKVHVPIGAARIEQNLDGVTVSRTFTVDDLVVLSPHDPSVELKRYGARPLTFTGFTMEPPST